MLITTWSRPFSGKSLLTNFQTLIHQISLLADFTHFEQPFHCKTQKQPILRHLSFFLIYLKFQVNLAELSLKLLRSRTKINLLKSFSYVLRIQVNLAEVSLTRFCPLSRPKPNPDHNSFPHT